MLGVYHERRRKELTRRQAVLDSHHDIYALMDTYYSNHLAATTGKAYTKMFGSKSIGQYNRDRRTSGRGGGPLTAQEKDAVVVDLAGIIAGKSRQNQG